MAVLLIVDDDRLVLATLSKGLSDCGHEVIATSTGELALAACDERTPDLALLDARMPGMSGIQVATRLREMEIPFIFLSAYGDSEVVNDAVAHGAYSYLVKPIDVPQIIPAIQAALARAEDLRRLQQTEKQLSTALGTGREISVAVGLIMERHRLTADEAFERLRAIARSTRRKVNDVAIDFVKASETINQPEPGHDRRARKVKSAATKPDR
jgi:response regulator NasT